MSTLMYHFLEKLEEMMNQGQLKEGDYINLCRVIKDLPVTDSQEDYWRQNYEKEKRQVAVEQERNDYLVGILQFMEVQNNSLGQLVDRLHKEKTKYFIELDRLKKEKDEKAILIDFFKQLENLESIPRHKKNPYTKEEIERMPKNIANGLYNKIYKN